MSDEFDIEAFLEQMEQQQLERLRHPVGWVPPNARPKSNRRSTVHQMKITLRDVRPAVWRRVVIPSTWRLDDVAALLLAAMGWTNSHLHCFYIGDMRYDMVGDWSEGDELDEAAFTLRDVFDEVGRTMRFEYDFGDGWEHDVLLEAVRVSTKAEADPYCLAGRRACPPEDCGGPYGYAELLRVRTEGAETEWERQQLQWLSEFDPDRFDVAEATQSMQHLLGPLYDEDVL